MGNPFGQVHLMTEEIKWYYRPWVVILLLFFVLGPFGLPLVYKSPKFSRKSKGVWTAVMAVYTGYLVYATWAVVERFYGIVVQLQAILG